MSAPTTNRVQPHQKLIFAFFVLNVKNFLRQVHVERKTLTVTNRQIEKKRWGAKLKILPVIKRRPPAVVERGRLHCVVVSVLRCRGWKNLMNFNLLATLQLCKRTYSILNEPDTRERAHEMGHPPAFPRAIIPYHTMPFSCPPQNPLHHKITYLR